VRTLPLLFENNRAWAEQMKAKEPDFFAKLGQQQAPQYLWIGCSDSRVPANQIVGLAPGELFVHRNVANVVVHTDLNCLSVLQYAVEVLQVRHVIVCGHYGCGGVRAVLDGAKLGLIDNWLRHVKDVYERFRAQIDVLDPAARLARLCELNVLAQAAQVCETTIVQNAWSRGQPLDVHAWIYGIDDGLLRDLRFGVGSAKDMAAALERAHAAIASGRKLRPRPSSRNGRASATRNP
jgi:carbonic anhydrase